MSKLEQSMLTINIMTTTQYRPGVSLVFLLGQVTDKLVMSELREENLVSGDLVQISVRDHYTALSYKTLSGFIWVNR